MFSTLGNLQYIRGVQYIGGCHDACGGIIRVHRGMFSPLGDTMSTLGDIMSTSGDIMMHVGKQVGKNLSISIDTTNNFPKT